MRASFVLNCQSTLVSHGFGTIIANYTNYTNTYGLYCTSTKNALLLNIICLRIVTKKSFEIKPINMLRFFSIFY